MSDKSIVLNNLINSCIDKWQNTEPFIDLGDYYLSECNNTLCYLTYLYAFQLGYENIANKLFKLEEQRQSSIFMPEKNNTDSSILVSVIMPTYNRQTIISESIASVLSQKALGFGISTLLIQSSKPCFVEFATICLDVSVNKLLHLKK